MVDISPTLVGSSERLNADDLTEEGKVITVTHVELTSDTRQPLAVHYEDENGKPYYPCTTMRRVIAHLWGIDGSKFKGRQLFVYRDPKVIFGKEMVGGIRIKGASNIDKPVTCVLTIGRGKKGKLVITPLKSESPSVPKDEGKALKVATNMADDYMDKMAECEDMQALKELTSDKKYQSFMKRVREVFPDIAKRVDSFIERTIKYLSINEPTEDDEEEFLKL